MKKSNIIEIKLIVKLSFLLFAGTTITCKPHGKENSYKTYVNYIVNPEKSKIDKRNGEVVLVFTSYFKNDNIVVEINNQTILHENLVTEDVTGLAKILKLGKIDKIKILELSLNRGKKVQLNCNSENQLFIISLVNDTLKINSVKYLPSFR